MNSSLRSQSIITSVEGFIHSRAETTETSTFVHTSAGIAIESGDELWSPVQEFTHGMCYTVHINEVRADPAYWHGKARVSMVQLHMHCPCDSHFCQTNPIPIGAALGMKSFISEVAIGRVQVSIPGQRTA